MEVKVFGILFLTYLCPGILAETSPWKPPPFIKEQTLISRSKRSTLCYGDLGCFSNMFPFNNSGEALPMDPRFLRTRFFLFTSINEKIPRLLNRSDVELLRRSRYNSNLKTKFIIHGFQQHGLVNWTREMAKRFLTKEPINVVLVDWGRGSGWPYTQAVANTRVVGAEVAKMVQFLASAHRGDMSKFHLIGHSLGAHVAGYAGEILDGLGRITGLDPAEPNFKGTDPKVRLDPEDANFVDVIHTDGSEFAEISGYGLSDPVGDIDFYPNGGQNQPGCTRENWINVVSQSYEHGIIEAEDIMSCSHSRAISVFIESIDNDCHFQAYPCSSFRDFTRAQCLSCGDQPCPSMGLDADRYESSPVKPRGQFYLVTRKSSPYCGFTYGVEVHLSRTMQPTEGLLQLSFSGIEGHIANNTIYSQDFAAGQIYSELFLSSDQSDINSIDIRFTESSKIWSWLWTGTIQLEKIVIRDGNNGEIYIFCAGNRAINSGESVTLSVSTADC